MYNNQKKSALILGATGLTGSYCLEFLLAHSDYELIHVIIRKPLEMEHVKLKQHICKDFSLLNDYAHLFQVDEVFCCIGTTIKKAGSKESFKKVDLDIPVLAAKIAAENKVQLFSVISSIGAKKGSSNFYLSVKGSMEYSISNFDLPHIHIFRPSLIIGPRKEFRLGEQVGGFVIRFLGLFFIGKLKRFKAIHAKDLALFMIKKSADQKNQQIMIYERDVMF